MTNESTWRRVCVGGKLGAAVVAGVMALSATSYAATLNPNTVTTNPDWSVNTEGAGNTLLIGPIWNFTTTIQSDQDEAGYAFLELTADTNLTGVTFSVQDPFGSVDGAQVSWNSQSDGQGVGETVSIPNNENVQLTTSFLASETKYFVFLWDGLLRAEGGSLTATVEAIPLPAGLVLFLSGLAGIGFLGRYKAKRREPAVA